MATPLVPTDTMPAPVATLLEKSTRTRLKNDEYFLLLTNHAEFGLTVSTAPPPSRPAEGTLFLINRRVCRYFRKDGHNWRKKPDGKNVQESHEDLVVRGHKRLESTYATTVDNVLKRRVYRLLEREDLEHLVLVHYIHSNDCNIPRISSARSADLVALIDSAVAAVEGAGGGQVPQGLPGPGIMPQPVAVQGQGGMVWPAVPAPLQLAGHTMGSGQVAQVGLSNGLLFAVPLPEQQQQQQQQQQQYNPDPPGPPPNGGPSAADERSYDRQLSDEFSLKLSLEPGKQRQDRSAQAAMGAAPAAEQAWPQAQLGQEAPPEHMLSSHQSFRLSLLNSLFTGTDPTPFGDLNPEGHEVWAPGSLHPHPEEPHSHLPATGAGLGLQPSPGSRDLQLPATQADVLHLPGAQPQQQRVPAAEADEVQPGGLPQQDSGLQWLLKQLEEEEEQRRQQEGAGQGRPSPCPAGQCGSAEGTAGGNSSSVRSLDKLDSTRSWLEPLELSGAGSPVPKLPSWVPDLAVDTLPERGGQRAAAGEAGGGVRDHMLVLSPGDGAHMQEALGMPPPAMLPRQQRKLQQLATAQGGPRAEKGAQSEIGMRPEKAVQAVNGVRPEKAVQAENGVQAGPGKPAEPKTSRRRLLENLGSGGPGPAQRLKASEDVGQE